MNNNLVSQRISAWVRPGAIGLAVALAGAGLRPAGAAIAVGATETDFTIPNHKTGQALRLYSYQGNVILLDFWAYWCGPCNEAASDIEPNIVTYYRTNFGNANGVPFQLISISIDMSDPAEEDDFINAYGVELVGDDTTGAVYSRNGNDYIPYFVVINGTTNSSNYKAWEVLYSTDGYDPASIKSAIDSVRTPPPACVVSSPAAGATVSTPNVTLTAAVTTNGKLIKKVQFYEGSTLLGFATNAPYNVTWANAPLGAHAVFARALYGNNYHADSAAVNFVVGAPAPIVSSVSSQGSSLTLSWTGTPGASGMFQVQVATDLSASPGWQNVGTPSAAISITLDATNRAEFYRVVSP